MSGRKRKHPQWMRGYRPGFFLSDGAAFNLSLVAQRLPLRSKFNVVDYGDGWIELR